MKNASGYEIFFRHIREWSTDHRENTAVFSPIHQEDMRDGHVISRLAYPSENNNPVNIEIIPVQSLKNPLWRYLFAFKYFMQ